VRSSPGQARCERLVPGGCGRTCRRSVEADAQEAPQAPRQEGLCTCRSGVGRHEVIRHNAVKGSSMLDPFVLLFTRALCPGPLLSFASEPNGHASPTIATTLNCWAPFSAVPKSAPLPACRVGATCRQMETGSIPLARSRWV